MPWQEVSIVDQRREFVRLAMQEGANRRELCRRFGIHPDTGYKWLDRWAAGEEELHDHSRRPHSSPKRSAAAMEALVLSVRDAHPAWGARKIARRLQDEGIKPPALSTVHAILQRHDRIVAPVGAERATQRFEKPAPNVLWQMDFKGWVRLANGSPCHPLTVVDDHSRYVPCLKACADEQAMTVQGHLQTTFQHYGLPDALFVDNGGPWGDSSGARWTRLGVWLLKLGVEVWHSRPYHPQSRGKNERFHRTLKDEVFALRRFRDFADVQHAFDRWLEVYNFERPHEALNQDVPASRYRPSARSMPGHFAECGLCRGRDRAPRRHHQGLCQLQRTALARPTRLLRRTRCTATPECRWPIWNLLRRLSDRRNRLDRSQTCRSCLRTPVGYVSGLNT
jgi:putative transposase